MKILCPYVSLNAATEFALQTEHYVQTSFIYVGGSNEDYFWAVRGWWKLKEKFIVIDQDIIPYPGLLRNLDNCSADLCLVRTPHGYGADDGIFSYGIGIWRFSDFLLRQVPDWLDRPGLTRKWEHIDGEIVTPLMERFPPHFHEPPVTHLNRNRFPIRESLATRF